MSRTRPAHLDPPLTVEETDLITRYRQCSAIGQVCIGRFVDFMLFCAQQQHAVCRGVKTLARKARRRYRHVK